MSLPHYVQTLQQHSTTAMHLLQSAKPGNNTEINEPPRQQRPLQKRLQKQRHRVRKKKESAFAARRVLAGDAPQRLVQQCPCRLIQLLCGKLELKADPQVALAPRLPADGHALVGNHPLVAGGNHVLEGNA